MLSAPTISLFLLCAVFFWQFVIFPTLINFSSSMRMAIIQITLSLISSVMAFSTSMAIYGSINDKLLATNSPNVSDFYPGLEWFDLQGVIKKMKVLAKRFDKIFESMIDQRQKMDRNSEMGAGVGQESKNFLQVLLKLKDEADSKMPLTMIELKALLMDMVVGGTDTTANVVEFAMAEIMNKRDYSAFHPDFYPLYLDAFDNEHRISFSPISHWNHSWQTI